MNTLTDSEFRHLVGEFHAEAGGDLVGMWEICKAVEELIGVGDVFREQCLLIVKALLARGLRAGDPPYCAGGYIPWPDQEPSKVISRIRSEWLDLGHSPNIPDIVWFTRGK